MPKHTETNLERLRYNGQSWSEVMSDNMQKMEDTLLKISGMLDVTLTSLSDGDILRWNATSEKYENLAYDTFFSTTTSTTSTTTAP